MDPLFQQFLQNVQDIIYCVVYDEEKNPKLEYISNYVETTLGYSTKDFFDNPLSYYAIIHPDDLEGLLSRVSILANSKDSISNTYRVKHKVTEEYIWFEDKSTPIFNSNNDYIGFISCGQNIDSKKQIELELKVTKNRLKLTFDTIVNGVIVHGQDGTILDFNPAAKRILGLYSNDHLIGEQDINAWLIVDEFGFPILKEDFPAHIAKRTREPVHDYVMGLLNSDGSIIWINVNAIPMLNGMGVIESFTDITERKKLVDASLKLKALLKETLRIAKIGSWELNILNNSFYWSDEIYVIFEKDPESTTPSFETYISLIHPEDVLIREKAYNDSIINITPSNLDHRLLFPDGRIKYVNEKFESFYDVDGKVIRTVGTIQDITERKLVEIELSQAKEKLQHFL
ncbi:MAG: PAS domain-containing protein [Candidatus Kapabacteria bacterium]|nr:PAS domain-containing protein [Candidatus Kapabacteria bacterium]